MSASILCFCSFVFFSGVRKHLKTSMWFHRTSVPCTRWIWSICVRWYRRGKGLFIQTAWWERTHTPPWSTASASWDGVSRHLQLCLPIHVGIGELYISIYLSFLGVGSIESEAVMLGQPVSLTLPEVVGCKLEGSINPLATSIDIVLGITKVHLVLPFFYTKQTLVYLEREVIRGGISFILFILQTYWL